MGSLDSRLALGLPRSDAPGDDATAVATIPDMRRAIEMAARTSQVVVECFKEAERRRLGREEIYVLLAYRALVELEDQRRVLERLESRPIERAISEDPDGHF